MHVLENCLYVLQEVRSIIYVQQFFHPLSLCSHGNRTNFAFTSYILVSAKFCNLIFLNNFYFVSFFYHLFICGPKKHKTCDIKQNLFIKIFLFKFLFSLLGIFLSYLSLLLNSNKASKIIFKTQFLT